MILPDTLSSSPAAQVAEAFAAAAAGPGLPNRLESAADHRAFEAVVRKNGGWMTAAALRITGDPAMAQEIVQDAFTLLARRLPRFPHEAALGAWLHRSVVFLARNQLAKRRRFEHKHLRFAQENFSAAADAAKSVDSAAENAGMGKALKLVDRLIQELPAKDRELITGRFFHNLSWAELAALCGRESADAARKRTERIVSRLAAELQRRGRKLLPTGAGGGRGAGVGSGAGLLAGAGLSVVLADQASASFLPATASSMAAAAAAEAARVPLLTTVFHTLSLMSATKPVLLTAVCCALLSAVPVVLLNQKLTLSEQHAAAELAAREAELKRLRQAAARPVSEAFLGSAALPGAGSNSGAAADTSGIPLASKVLGKIGPLVAGVAAGAAGPPDQVNEALTGAVKAVMEDPDRNRRVSALGFLLQWMRPADVKSVEQALRDTQKPGVLYVNETNAFRERWAQINGREAMESYVQGDTMKAYNRLHAAVVKGWASADPEGLMAWLNALPPECDWKEKASGDLLRGLVENNPARATDLLLKQPDPRAIAAGLPLIADRLLQEQGPEGLGQWLRALPARPETEPARSRVAFQLAESEAFRDPQAAVDCLKSFDSEAWGGAKLAAQLGKRFGGASPDKALAMLDLLPPDSLLATSLGGALFESLAANQPNTAATWLNAHADSPHADRAAAALALSLKKSNAEAAAAWAGKIRRDDHRAEVLRTISAP